MNFGSFKKNVETRIKEKATKFLSKEVQEELGMVKSEEFTGDEQDLNTFWTPVQQNALTAKNSEQVSAWVIGIIVVLALILVGLIIQLSLPDTKSYDVDNGNLVVVNGEEKNIVEAKLEDDMPEGEKLVSENKETGEKVTVAQDGINITNIKLSHKIEKEKIYNSPLLKSKKASITEYKVQNGDTIESIAIKFYGSKDYESIKKIKTANNIRNSRLLQIGQKIIIPF